MKTEKRKKKTFLNVYLPSKNILRRTSVKRISLPLQCLSHQTFLPIQSHVLPRNSDAQKEAS